MDTTTPTLDCRGLTPALSILRIKQAFCSDRHRATTLRVALGSECARDAVSDALGAVAARVRWVTLDADAPTDAPHAPAEHAPDAGPPWWERPDLAHRDGRLHLGEADLEALAGQVGTPAYVCRAARVGENVARLSGSLAAAGLDHRIYYAIKANRSPALLTYMRTRDLCGVDVCSAGELLHAVSCGFPASAISFTGTSLSRRDVEVLASFPQVRVNCDSLSSLEALGRACPGRSVGLRINPGLGIGYHGDDRLKYSGAKTTKFGIYREHLQDALAIAATWGLRIVRVHVHAGCGYLDAELAQLEAVLDATAGFVAEIPGVEEVNLGGGLGVPHTAADQPLDLARWAGAVAQRFGGRGLVVAVEPGDYLVKDAGLLLTTVTYVERRRDTLFAGLDAGFNLAMEPAFYGLPCEPVAVTPRPEEGTETYTVAGNVNEALDVWAVGHRMPRLREGDRVALINAGGYAAAMRSEHCLRGAVGDVLLID